ncbi:transmembrane protein 223 [Sceloporus undulatus]|uniref:transmembrane protein 223 n=1 Tax=Sceloporus undulatus TaxID=8520 RepID=UPI001C4BA22E|nr:transmembrane protein 223 [Sceloporus undulatus]
MLASRCCGVRLRRCWGCLWPGFGHWRGASSSSSAFPLEVSSAAVPRDVLLFQHERRRFFRLLGLFCAGQFVFWASLAHLAFTTLRAPARDQEAAAPRGGEPASSLRLGSGKWRLGFTASCLTAGSLILVAGFVFSRRSVCRVLLHRGGQNVTLTTYYPFAFTSSFTVPLRHVSCMSHRLEVPAMIPLKIKGKPFYFLLDKQGRITNTQLFDITVGAYRKL